MAVMEAERVIVNGKARYYPAGYRPLNEWLRSVGIIPEQTTCDTVRRFGPLIVAARICFTRKGRRVVIGDRFATRPVVRFTLKRLPAVPDA